MTRVVPALVAVSIALAASARGDGDAPVARGAVRQPSPRQEDARTMDRKALVDELRRQGIADPAVLAAIERVPRHEFVPPALSAEAYANQPLPIGSGQTISQPYIVAFMTEAAGLERTSNVLEIGTGSGYQAAILAEILGLRAGAEPGPTGRLASIEVLPVLAEQAKALLADLGYAVDVRAGDGYRGWPERAPFDAILVTAAPDHVPQPLKEQLRIGGRLIIPVGDEHQQLKVITRTAKGYQEETVLPVRFVPMTGEAERRR